MATISLEVCLSVRLSIRVEQLGSFWMDFVKTYITSR